MIHETMSAPADVGILLAGLLTVSINLVFLCFILGLFWWTSYGQAKTNEREAREYREMYYELKDMMDNHCCSCDGCDDEDDEDNDEWDEADWWKEGHTPYGGAS